MILKSIEPGMKVKFGTVAALIVVYAVIVSPVYSAHLCFGIIIASMLLLTVGKWTKLSTWAFAFNLIAMALCLGKLIG